MKMTTKINIPHSDPLSSGPHESKSHYWPGGVTGCWFKMLITHRISMAHCINIQKIIIIKFPSIIIKFPVRRGSGALANQPLQAQPRVLMITSAGAGISRWKHPQSRAAPHRAGTNDHKGFPSHPDSSNLASASISRWPARWRAHGVNNLPRHESGHQMWSPGLWHSIQPFQLADRHQQNLPDTSFFSIH